MTLSFFLQIWAHVYMVFVLCSVAVIVLETSTYFRRTHPYQLLVKVTNNFTRVFSSQKEEMEVTTDVDISLLVLGQITVPFFTIELLVRFFSAPNKKRFLMKALNILDIACVVVTLSMAILFYMGKTALDGDTQNAIRVFIFTLRFCRVINVLRLIRLARLYTGLQVIILTIRDSVPELSLFLLVLTICMVIFSSIMYYAEYYFATSHFTDIPVGFWWSVVTMTTVGYGDKYPQTIWGFLVGTSCAIIGIIFTGFPIPIISNKFNVYYEFSKVREERLRRIEENEQKAVSFKGSVKRVTPTLKNSKTAFT